MAKDRKPTLSETEIWIVQTTTKERYGEDCPTEVIDSEIRLHPDDRTQFYYRAYEQYGTGRLEYDDIGDCVVTLLQVQADHERKAALQRE